MNFKSYSGYYLFLAPMLILYAVFTLYPMVFSWYYAFFDWDGIGPLDDFIGLGNFVEATRDPYMWGAFGHTLIYAVVNVAVQLALGLLLAMLLNQSNRKGRGLYRLLLFIPVVTTTAIVGVVFTVLLNPAGGPINEALLQSGLASRPLNFLGSMSLSLPTVIGISIWNGVGVVIIYWLAGLQTIPADVYEAARIDGASRAQMFFRITIPLLLPIGLIILLLTFLNNLNPFDLIQTLTAGGPNKATDVIQTYIFRYAFNPEASYPRYGFASAVGVLFGLTVMIITGIQAWVLKRARSSSNKS